MIVNFFLSDWRFGNSFWAVYSKIVDFLMTGPIL